MRNYYLHFKRRRSKAGTDNPKDTQAVVRSAPHYRRVNEELLQPLRRSNDELLEPPMPAKRTPRVVFRQRARTIQEDWAGVESSQRQDDS